jgi:hypothetical protein
MYIQTGKYTTYTTKTVNLKFLERVQVAATKSGVHLACYYY